MRQHVFMYSMNLTFQLTFRCSCLPSWWAVCFEQSVYLAWSIFRANECNNIIPLCKERNSNLYRHIRVYVIYNTIWLVAKLVLFPCNRNLKHWKGSIINGHIKRNWFRRRHDDRAWDNWHLLYEILCSNNCESFFTVILLTPATFPWHILMNVCNGGAWSWHNLKARLCTAIMKHNKSRSLTDVARIAANKSSLSSSVFWMGMGP
jgi:hypothetical protein